MRWWVALALAVAGCGRVAFDPLAGDASGATGDDAARGDANAVSDGAGAACASAIPVTGGVTTVDTCAGGDRLVGCGPGGTPEAVFAFTPPATGVYTVTAFETGTTQKQQLGFYDASCTTPRQCAGSLTSTFDGGLTYAVSVESPIGGCVTVDFTITAN